MRGTNTHLNFDINLAKNESDENPVFYLQYAHARLCNILKHAETQGHDLKLHLDLRILKLDSELSLIKSIIDFPNIIETALASLEPQNIANYLQDISSKFHKYYAKERVIDQNAEKTNARLILVKALQIVLSNGLSILGINAPKRM